MNILEQIVEVKKEELVKLKSNYKLSSFRDSEFFELPPLNFAGALNKKERLSIIAEVKKASPSKGVIRPDFNHLKIADSYFESGADAVSILTDENFFKGSINYLKDIAGIKSAPLLRKEFIIDEYQVYQSKAAGADAILLICEILSAGQIKELTLAAKETGLAVLLELHSSEQMKKIDFSLNKIIGINNRNLEDFSVSLETTKFVAEVLKDDIICVSESGINKDEDIEFVKKTKAKAVLVGEHFMRSENIKDKFTHFKNKCFYES
jgi:indole-3-glycerol phosphate synthase